MNRGTIGFPRDMDRAAVHTDRFSIHTDLFAIRMEFFATGMDRFRPKPILFATQLDQSPIHMHRFVIYNDLFETDTRGVSIHTDLFPICTYRFPIHTCRKTILTTNPGAPLANQRLQSVTFYFLISTSYFQWC